jgi:hypothetical protein
MIKGNMHLLLEYKTLDTDINELKLMTYNDNLVKHYITPLENVNMGEEVIISLIYDNIDAYKFKGSKVEGGILITEDAEYFSFQI